jgi:ABC-type polysaccharide transport system permease subunit
MAWPFIVCAFNAWKWCGYNSIIYIAAFTTFDQDCYEAADIDGANIKGHHKIRESTRRSKIKC